MYDNEAGAGRPTIYLQGVVPGHTLRLAMHWTSFSRCQDKWIWILVRPREFLDNHGTQDELSKPSCDGPVQQRPAFAKVLAA